MNNLEKSEMKYRITQLQGELNWMKYVNEQQKITISNLERENAQLKNSRGEQGSESTVNEKDVNKKNEEDVTEKDEFDRLEIPDIDLQIIKDSRFQLTKSMKEVIHLLRSPVNTNIDYLELPEVGDTSNSFEELFNNEKVENFVFNGYNNSDNNNNNSNSSSNADKNNNDKEKASYIDNYFNNDEDDANDTSKMAQELLEKLDTQSLGESDSETVVLDGSNELDFNNDGTTEPKVEDHEAEKPLTQTSPVKFHDYTFPIEAEFEKTKVFNNPQDDIAICISYGDPQNKLRFTLYQVRNHEILLSLSVQNSSFLDNIDTIIDLYCMWYHPSDGVARLVSVNKTGEINQIVLDAEDSMSTTVLNFGVHDLEIESSGLIAFAHNHGSFGLVVSLVSKAQTCSFKVYELLAGPRNDLKVEELGSYTKGFFKNLKAPDHSTFQVLKWFKAALNSANVVSSAKSKKTGHKRTLSNTDASLSPYQLVLRLDKNIFLFNIVLKQSTVITNYYHGPTKNWLDSNNGKLILQNPIDEESFQLEVYDLENNASVTSPNLITCNKLPDPGMRYYPVGDEPLIVEVNSDALSIYDGTFKVLDTKPIAGEVYRTRNGFVTKEKDVLHVYTLS